MKCQTIPAYDVDVETVGAVIRPVGDGDGCPFHICALEHIGCLYLSPEGHVKKKCWRAIVGNFTKATKIQCRIDFPDFGPVR